MKSVAKNERAAKTAAQNRCVQLERALYACQNQNQNSMMPGPSFYSHGIAPTRSPMMNLMFEEIGTSKRTESDSIESIEIPEYLK